MLIPIFYDLIESLCADICQGNCGYWAMYIFMKKVSSFIIFICVSIRIFLSKKQAILLGTF